MEKKIENWLAKEETTSMEFGHFEANAGQ